MMWRHTNFQNCINLSPFCGLQQWMITKNNHCAAAAERIAWSVNIHNFKDTRVILKLKKI